MTTLNDELVRHWHMLRRRTYDLMDVLGQDDLDKKLPFPRSQSIRYQFWCMLGSQESWVAFLKGGALEHWSCSLSGLAPAEMTLDVIRQRFHAANVQYLAALTASDVIKPYSNGLTPLIVHEMLVEHEAHHHGQLINFIFALDLPIPASWAHQWALSRE